MKENRSTRRTFRVLLIVALMAMVFPSLVAGSGEYLEPLNPAPTAENGLLTDESTSLWFVEMPSGPTADGSNLNTVRQEKAAFRANASRAGVRYTERRAFDTLWNGLSIEIGASELSKLSRLQGVKAIYPVETVSIPTTNPAPDLNTALAMTGADIAQNELGLSGEGVRVAVMDTGIDYDHPDLGAGFGPGYRVITGWDFVGDDFNADPTSPAYNPVPVPDADPDDCNGHGTHVAGIVGASGDPAAGGVLGVAPGVKFGAYRVFGCAGSTTADIMVAAMERALSDNMQVLNMSIGSAFQWPQYPTAQASDRLVNRGMVVVASIGNSGANGLYSVGAPGIGKKVIGVASYDNSHVALNTFTITPDNMPIGYGPATAAPLPPTSGSLLMDRTGTPTTNDDACAPLIPGSLSGKAALIRRGTCSFHIKALNAQNAGAAAVVLYNNSPGRFSPTVAGTPPITIPVVAISDAEGVLINTRMDVAPVTMTWTNQTGIFPNPTGGLISSFSSYGMPPDLSLKPDLGAPGGLIRSTYPLENGGYATISGTSMASPHVAGGVALLLQARPNTNPQAVRTILQNSADPKAWWGNPGLGYLDQVHRQGAGMLDIDDSILATTKVEPAKLALGESEAGPAVRTLTIANNGSMPVTYDLSHVAALSTGPNTFTPGATTGFATATFSASSVTVPAGGSATVDVTITANPALADRSMYGGYLVFTPQGAGQTYRVPYAGFKGDYQSIPAMTAGGAGFPLLAKLTACTRYVGNDCTMGASYDSQPTGATYTMQRPEGGVYDIPYFLVHLDHQVAKLRAEVFDATTGRSYHRAFDLQYLPRSSTSTGFFAFAWDGTTTNGNRINTVPDGQYVVRLSALKALGDDSNPAHWETWTSPVITVDRP